MRARIQYDGFDKVESAKLKPFLEIADYFARRWDKTVVLDAPGGQECAFEMGDDHQDRVYVHFFGCPAGFQFAEEDIYSFGNELSPATDLFYMSLPKSASILTARGNSPVIQSPEGRRVAQVLKNHIFILFDLNSEWDVAIPILWEILERSAVHLPKNGVEDSKKFQFSLEAHGKMHSRLTQRGSELAYDFRRISTVLLEREYSAAFETWEMKHQEMLTAEKDLSAVALRIAMASKILNDAKLDAELSTDALRQEFETLFQGEGLLLGVEVHGGELHIFTKPIEHIQQNGERSMLSQYKIVLIPAEGDKTRSGNTFGAIKMAEWGWRGPFHHPEANIKNTYGGDAKAPCFGTQIVQSVHKALLDHDYKVLISLLLLYLAGDNRVPGAREKSQQDKEIYEPKPFYRSEYARNQAREEYASFVRQYRGEFRRKALEKEMQEAKKQEQEKTALYNEARKEWLLFGAKIKFLRSYIDALPIGAEFEEVRNLPALAHMLVGPDFIWVVFGPGRGVGSGPFKDIWFSGTFRVLVKPQEGWIRIWGMPSSSLTEEGFLKERAYSGGDFRGARHVKNLFAKGLFGKAFLLMHNILRGQDLDEEKMPKEEVLTRELVEQYLREHAFPDFEPLPYPNFEPLPYPTQTQPYDQNV